MVVKIPAEAELDPRVMPDLGILDEYKEEVVGTAIGFPLMGLGLTQVFRMVDQAQLTASQKAWTKGLATLGLGFGGGLGIIAVSKGAKHPSLREGAIAAGIGAAAVGLGSLALQGFQAARGAGILPRKSPEGQILPPTPAQILPLPPFSFR